MKTPTYLTVAEAAERLGVCPQRVIQWLNGGRLPRSFRHQRAILIHPADAVSRPEPRPPGRKKTPKKSADSA